MRPMGWDGTRWDEREREREQSAITTSSTDWMAMAILPTQFIRTLKAAAMFFDIS